MNIPVVDVADVPSVGKIDWIQSEHTRKTVGKQSENGRKVFENQSKIAPEWAGDD